MRIFKNRYNEPRSGWILALGGVFCLILAVGGGLLVDVLFSPHSEAILNKPIGYVVLDLVYMVVQEGGMVLGGWLALWLLTRRPLGEMGFWDSHTLRNLGLGLAAGFVPIALVFALEALVGGIQLAGLNTAVLGNVSWWGRLPVYILVGIGEEALCRGFMMTALKPTRRRLVILLLPAVLFALLHATNPGFGALPFINIILAGVFFGALFLGTGSLTAPIAAHFIWNWAEGCLFGLGVSGTSSLSLIEALPAEGRALWHGGAFGAEGGLAVTLVLAAATALALWKLKPPADAAWTPESGLPLRRRRAEERG